MENARRDHPTILLHQTARRVQAHTNRVWLGCSGSAHPTWKPDFYPPKTSPKKMLEYYATQLNSVEVNYTFRHLPSPATVEGWLAQTGGTFASPSKLRSAYVHQAIEGVQRRALCLLLGPLPVVRAGRMGLVLFQLPPNLKADLARLAAFLQEAAPASTGCAARCL